jgi:sarcosine oxidase
VSRRQPDPGGIDGGVAVVGGGIIGLATAYALRERGAAVDLYERGRPGNGQSGGEGRIFRHAHDDSRLIEIAREAREIWSEWARALGVELVSADGALAIGDPVAARLAGLREAGGVDVEGVDADAALEALPILAPFEADAMLDRGGGALRTTAAVAALTAALGEAVITDEVIGLRPLGDGVELRSGGVSARYRRVVVCAGVSTGALARSVGVQIPVSAAAHLRATFALREPAPARLACFQDGSGSWGESGVYATPAPGNRHYSVGLAGTTAVREDGGLVDSGALAEFDRRVVAYVERALPGLVPEPIEHRHCWVTELPWGADGLGVWERGGILLCAGHNLFKQAPFLGRALADAALGAELDERLRPEAELG